MRFLPLIILRKKKLLDPQISGAESPWSRKSHKTFSAYIDSICGKLYVSKKWVEPDRSKSELPFQFKINSSLFFKVIKIVSVRNLKFTEIVNPFEILKFIVKIVQVKWDSRWTLMSPLDISSKPYLLKRKVVAIYCVENSKYWTMKFNKPLVIFLFKYICIFIFTDLDLNK